jgi:Amt family ammonium transporter
LKKIFRWCCQTTVELEVNTIKSVLYSGNYGDGMIFIYDVENVIKVRIGETGFDALQS